MKWVIFLFLIIFSFDPPSFIRGPVSIVVAAGRGAKFPLSGFLVLSVREFPMFLGCVFIIGAKVVVG